MKNIQDELREELQKPSDRTLGEAANRYVTFQIVVGVFALIVFAVIAFFVFTFMWRAMNAMPW